MPEEYDDDQTPEKIPPVLVRKYLKLTVHTMDRDRTQVDIGPVSDEEFKTVMSGLDATYAVLASSNGVVFTDTRGKTFFFNKNNITLIEMDLV